jgi:hypothetical protein
LLPETLIVVNGMTNNSCMVLILNTIVIPFKKIWLNEFEPLRIYLVHIHKMLIDVNEGNWKSRWFIGLLFMV